MGQAEQPHPLLRVRAHHLQAPTATVLAPLAAATLPVGRLGAILAEVVRIRLELLLLPRLLLELLLLPLLQPPRVLLLLRTALLLLLLLPLMPLPPQPRLRLHHGRRRRKWLDAR